MATRPPYTGKVDDLDPVEVRDINLHKSNARVLIYVKNQLILAEIL